MDSHNVLLIQTRYFRAQYFSFQGSFDYLRKLLG